MDEMLVDSLFLSISTSPGSAVNPECRDHNNTTTALKMGKREAATPELLRRRT